LSSVRATELDHLLLGVTMNQDDQRLFGGVLPLDEASETLHFVRNRGDVAAARAGPGGDRRTVDMALAPSDSRIKPVARRVTRSFGILEGESRAWPSAGR
jgi:hypothetical protein